MWVMTAVFVAMAAFLGASIATGLISASVWTPKSGVSAVRGETSGADRALRLSQYGIVAERNLFNANPKSIAKQPTSGKSNIPAYTPAQSAAPIKALLVGTAVRENAMKSFAMIDVDGKVEPYLVGEELQPGVKLDEVLADRVYLRQGKARSELLLFTDKPTKGAATARGGRKPRRGSPRKSSRQPVISSDDTIRKVGEDSWVIDRREIDQAMSNMSQLITQVRVVPNLTPDGSADGFRVFAMRPQSLFTKIGLMNNDIIKEVNGLQLNGIDQAYNALNKLKDESSVSINLLRNNQPKTLSYEIR